MIARFKLWLLGAAGILAAFAAVYIKGRHDQSGEQYKDELNEYVETRRRIDDATIPRDATDALEWLRKRQSGGDM